MTGPITPFPEQTEALTSLTCTLAVHDRTTLVMACGTGKTLVGRWHAQASGAQRTLVFLPSLALVAQVLAEWRRDSSWSFEAMVVCSDKTTAAGAAERRNEDGEIVDVDKPYWAKAKAMVTIDPARAARFLSSKIDGRPQVVFCTYHSAPKAAEAMLAAGTVMDLVVYDEAHNLAGRPRPDFRVAMDSRKVAAHKRLFMTATPLTFGAADGDDVISMDNVKLFGPRAHTVTFGNAIDAGRLTDYKVLVIASRDGERAGRHRNDRDIPAALLAAVDEHGIRRMLTFHSRVARATEFAETMDVTHTPGGVFIRAKVAHGKQRAGERAQTLRWLGEDQANQTRIVSSARCLREGVDVPEVDALLYADEMTSVIDIIQSLGRALRKAPGKEFGYVIIPVSLPADGDDDTNLSVSSFAKVWAVLRGLREHDERLADELDRKVMSSGSGRIRKPSPDDRVQFILPDDVNPDAVHLRMVQEAGSAWEKFYAAYADWAHTTGGGRLGRNTTHHGIGIGEWGHKQRRARDIGVLPADRIRRLEDVPGWYWSREHADWTDTWELAEAYANAHGTIADNTTGESKFDKANSKGIYRTKLGIWFATQRQLYRDGMLDELRAAKLEELPGWDWNAGLRDIDVKMIQALRLFVEFEKHPDVPADHMEDGQPLGRWVLAVRRAKVLDQVPPALRDELLAACPRVDKGVSTWKWEQPDTLWRMTYDALLQFVDREKKIPTGRSAEPFMGKDFNIGMWCARLRFLHRRGELDADYAKMMEKIPGWQWEIDLREKEYGEPIDLGKVPHGTAKGIQKKCPCKPCLDARRDRDLVYLNRKRQLKDPVNINRACAHLAMLEANGVKRSAIVAVSGVPLGVIRRIAVGEGQVEREHETLLLGTSLADCRAAVGRIGSRGRVVLLANEKVDAGPTWERIEDLTARGLGPSWIARELGYTSAYVQLRKDVVSRRIAEQIADLYQRAEGLSFDRKGRNITAPPLSELRAAAVAA